MSSDGLRREAIDRLIDVIDYSCDTTLALIWTRFSRHVVPRFIAPAEPSVQRSRCRSGTAIRRTLRNAMIGCYSLHFQTRQPRLSFLSYGPVRSANALIPRDGCSGELDATWRHNTTLVEGAIVNVVPLAPFRQLRMNHVFNAQREEERDLFSRVPT